MKARVSAFALFATAQVRKTPDAKQVKHPIPRPRDSAVQACQVLRKASSRDIRSSRLPHCRRTSAEQPINVLHQSSFWDHVRKSDLRRLNSYANPKPRPTIHVNPQRNEDRQCELDVPQLLGPKVPSQIRLRRLRKDNQVASRRLKGQLFQCPC